MEAYLSNDQIEKGIEFLKRIVASESNIYPVPILTEW